MASIDGQAEGSIVPSTAQVEPKRQEKDKKKREAKLCLIYFNLEMHSDANERQDKPINLITMLKDA